MKTTQSPIHSSSSVQESSEKLSQKITVLNELLSDLRQQKISELQRELLDLQAQKIGVLKRQLADIKSSMNNNNNK